MKLLDALGQLVTFRASYAQQMEDIIINRYFHNVKKGFYVDVGCNHPAHYSVTKMFYDKGWRGVNIDPLKSVMDMYPGERPEDINICAAVSDKEGLLEFYEDGQCSTVSQEDAARRGLTCKYSVESMPLSRLLDGLRKQGKLPEDIHFLKIDVEDHEREVVEGMDWKRYRPWLVVIESTLPETYIASHDKWESKLVDNGYSFLAAHGVNRYYAADEKAALLTASYLSAPAEPFIKDEELLPIKRLWVSMSMD
ncbi:FkbM family methyltransferase [Desulfovibrio sp. OttesenSCG-928-C06]|nr:FkbM family methyltransferase [Desulfovibrio sp. OttesenSCG-928-C06]